VEIRSVIKLLGAAATGGYLALKLRKPRKSYYEFVELYDIVGIDFLHQVENLLFHSLLPFLDDRDLDELEQLLDRQATYQEKLRFCQKKIPEFNEKVIRAINRIGHSDNLAQLIPKSRRRSIRADDDALQLVLKELNQVLEQCFDEAMIVNMPELERKAFRHLCREKPSLGERLVCFNRQFDSFGSVLFDALSRFEEKIFQAKG